MRKSHLFYHSIFISAYMLLNTSLLTSQEIIYGTNNYIEYQKGTLPIVISVPHGGTLAPTTIPDRTCNNAETVTDKFTIELAQSISKALHNLTGCYPSLIICRLKRSKIDCNRNIEDGACGDPNAIIAWNEFNSFVNQAQTEAQNNYEGNIFYVDLHGHAHPIPRIELGYLLYGSELRLPDDSLNKSKYINYSSIKDLALVNEQDLSHAELLRGSHALGSLLGDASYPTVPSIQIPYPLEGEGYFNGGYNVANHTSYQSGNSVSGVQMECYYEGIRDTEANRGKFGDSLARILIDYLNIHRNVDINNCNILNNYEEYVPSISIFPNPVSRSERFLHIDGLTGLATSYFLYSLKGELIEFGDADRHYIHFENELQDKMYILSLQNAHSNTTFKLMVE